MGPVMPPSKKPEASGVSVASGLSPLYQVSSITRALCDDDELELALPVPAIKLEKSGAEDEELTNLNWLHESKNLLTSFGDPVLRSVSPVQEPDDDPPPSPATSDLAYDAKHNPNCKPPYSFSCLIFMAIEDAPSKRLPVKDIYNWILEHFPYFANAPTGWKNSVRHNLSLNKCFKKVDKDRSQVRVLLSARRTRHINRSGRRWGTKNKNPRIQRGSLFNDCTPGFQLITFIITNGFFCLSGFKKLQFLYHRYPTKCERRHTVTSCRET